ncbi:hypothetical protein HNV12_21950 [Methanococcoides sp. SA1]|nr:hypothetical protein [Methanococcoides sp. SA1]NPE30565.1 hypothetical protein [Methanococcoides sp. SA1]
MKLQNYDKELIVEIMAASYFAQQGWKWINLKRDADKLYKIYDELVDQYNAYPYMSKDWYVENSSSKSIHMCSKWQEFKDLVDFLKAYSDDLDFLVNNNNNKMFCIKSVDGDISDSQKHAIAEARNLRCNVFVFKASVPDNMDFEILQVGGGY